MSRPVRRLAAGWIVVVLCGAAGCTICPDPFDYSGPVPDGSAPQNDFRARANGIAPIGGVSRPWPPVVQAAPDDHDDEAAPVAIGVAVAVDAAPADGEDMPAAPDDSAATAVQPVAAEAAERPAAGDGVADRSGDEPPTLEEILPAARAPRPEIAPPLRETPGWRPRG